MIVKLRNEHSGSVERMVPAIYDDLRRMAEAALRRERPDHTLQATALVHEAYLRLVNQRTVEWQDRTHVCAVAAQAIRRILVDHARSRGRVKRGGGLNKLSLTDVGVGTGDDAIDWTDLDAALARLAATDPRKALVVELRFFGGLTVADIAEALALTPRTVERDWRFARAWLYRELVGVDPGPDSGGES